MSYNSGRNDNLTMGWTEAEIVEAGAGHQSVAGNTQAVRAALKSL